MATSTSVTINDTSVLSTYSVSPAASTVNEGSSVTFNVSTTNVSNGTQLFWTVDNSTTAAADFSAVSGNFVVTSNSGSFSVSLVADAATEGSESFRVRIRTVSTSGTIVATSSFVTVNDTSVATPTYSVNLSSSTVAEGASITATVTTTNVLNGTTLYYVLEQTAGDSFVTADFASNTGSFNITSNTGTVLISPTADETLEGNESYRILIKTGSTSGPTVATSTNFTIQDTSTAPPVVRIIEPSRYMFVNETFTFNVITEGVQNGTTLYWEALTEADKLSSSSGTFTITSNQGSFTVTASSTSADKTTARPFLRVGCRITNAAGRQAGQSNRVYIMPSRSTTLPLKHIIEPPLGANYFAQNIQWESLAVSDTFVAAGLTRQPYTEASGQVHVYSRSTGNLIYTIENPNAYSTTTLDAFGFRAAMSDKIMAVSASGEDANGQNATGIIYLFDPASGRPLDALGTIDVGVALAPMTGDIAVDNTAVYWGYPLNDFAANDAGQVRVQRIYGGTVTDFIISNPSTDQSGDRFGSTVGISNSYLITSSPNEDGTFSNEGRAYVYLKDLRSLWFTIENPSPSLTGTFGDAATISDDYAVVSQYTLNKVYVYRMSGPSERTLLYTINQPQPNDSVNNNFGFKVALSGQYLAIASPNKDRIDSGTSQFGRVYVYDLTVGVSSPLYTLLSPEANIASFGTHLAALGGRFYVGNSTFGFNRNYKIFEYTASTGAAVKSMNIPKFSQAESFLFGRTVAINDSFMLVGQPRNALSTNPGQGNSGAVHLFNIGTGATVFTRENPNAFGDAQNDNFGAAIAMSPSYFVVGAMDTFGGEDDLVNDNSGKAYLYNISGTLLHTINNPNINGTTSADNFGFGVAINDTYVVVSANLEDVGAASNVGVVYVWPISGFPSSRVNIIHPSNTVNALFGRALDINTNNQLIIASSGDNRAFIYSATGSIIWTLTGPSGVGFATSVAINNTYAVVGATGVSASSGAVYVYSLATGSLERTITNPNVYDIADGDQFGTSVDISNEGVNSRIIVGALQEDSAGGLSSGAAYVFNAATGGLLQTFVNENAFSTGQADQYGIKVAISSTHLVATTEGEDDRFFGESSGKAYVYQLPVNMAGLNLPAGVTLNTTTTRFNGRSLDCNGTQSGSNLDFNIFDYTAVTVEMWLYQPSANSVSAGRVPFSFKNGVQIGGTFMATNGTNDTYGTRYTHRTSGNTAGQNQSGVTVLTNQWVLLTVETEYNGANQTRVRTYINGTRDPNGDDIWGIIGDNYSMPNISTFTLGNFGNSGFFAYNGLIGPVRVSQGLLYNGNSCTVPTASWTFTKDTILIIQ